MFAKCCLFNLDQFLSSPNIIQYSKMHVTPIPSTLHLITLISSRLLPKNKIQYWFVYNLAFLKASEWRMSLAPWISNPFNFPSIVCIVEINKGNISRFLRVAQLTLASIFLTSIYYIYADNCLNIDSAQILTQYPTQGLYRQD